jgi:AAA+ ATPase superfamily predicted ATPase
MALKGSAQKTNNDFSPQSEKCKMTLYINKDLAKQFKIQAIIQEMEYSELAELALAAYLREQKHRP